jgi:hypothetical protein
VAARSAEGGTKLTVAQVAVTDDTVTLAGAANLYVVAAAGDNVRDGAGVDPAVTQTASTTGAVMAREAATQNFLIESNDPAEPRFSKMLKGHSGKHFPPIPCLIERISPCLCRQLKVHRIAAAPISRPGRYSRPAFASASLPSPVG